MALRSTSRRRAARLLALGGSAAAVSMLAAPALAQSKSDWPSKPIRIVVPYPAGGIADKIAREVAERLTSRVHQSVLVDNRTGAAGNIGFEYVAQQPGDGYTLVLAPASNLTVNRVMFKQLPYDLDKDFLPLSLLITTPQLILVPTSSPVKSLKEFIDWTRANPGKASFAAGGIGSYSHLAGELLRSEHGANLTAVTYQGAAPALTDLVGGQVQLMFNEVITAGPYVKGGKLRALAIAAKNRAPWFPDVPTTAEVGYPDLEVVSWYGILARSGTPPAVMARLSKEIREIMQSDDMKKRYDEIGAYSVGSTPEEFARYIASETAKWVPLVKRANIPPQ